MTHIIVLGGGVNADDFEHALRRNHIVLGERTDAADKCFLRAVAGQLAQITANRADNATVGTGLFTARELEHRYTQILEERLPPLSALRLFPSGDFGVPPGAKTHTKKRVSHSGQAKVYRAGMEVPTVDHAAEEESFPTAHYVIGGAWDLFDEQAAQFGGFPLRPAKIQAMRDALLRLMNSRTWYGEGRFQGVLNYKWLRKQVIATPFNEASTTTAILRALNRFVAYPYHATKTVMRPNRLVVSPRVRQYLAETPMSVDNSSTILELFLQRQPEIKVVDEALELQEPVGGPTGLDGMLAYRDDAGGIANVIVQAPTFLPEEQAGFGRRVFAYATHGGVTMDDAGANVLGYVTPPSLY